MNDRGWKRGAQLNIRTSVWLFLAFGVMAVLSASILLYLSQQPVYAKTVYGNHEFVKKDGIWFTKMNVDSKNVEVPFRYSPEEVEQVPVSGTLPENYFKGTVYFTSESGEPPNAPYELLGIAEAAMNFRLLFKTDVVMACTFNNSICPDYQPIVTCNLTDKRVVYFNRTGTSGVEIRGNCIMVRGYNTESHRAADKLLYTAFGIVR